MSSDLVTPCPSSTPHPLPVARWGGLTALLIVEALVLGVQLEGADPAAQWWPLLLARRAWVPRLAIATLAATLLIGGNRFRAHLRRAAGTRPAPTFWLLVGGQVVAFAGFVLLTALVLQTDARASTFPVLWTSASCALGLLSLALGALAALPGRLWYRLLRSGWVTLLGGLAVGFAAVVVGWLADQMWRPLGEASLWVVHGLLTLVSAETVYQPAELTVGTPAYTIEVAPGCSGYQGVGLFWVFLGVYLFLFRRTLRFPHAVLLLPLGTVVVWLLNALRLFGAVVLGTWVSPALANGGFHSLAGWLAFNLLGLGMVAVTQRARFFARSPEATGGPNPTAAYLGPFLALVATAMLTGAFTTGFDYAYPLRVLVAAGVLWAFRRRYADLAWCWSWPAVAAGVGVFLLWVGLPSAEAEAGSGSDWRAALTGLPAGWAAGWLVLRLVGYVFAVPVAEELAFRGYLLRRLTRADFQAVPAGGITWFAVLASSVLFGVLHGRWLAGTVAGTAYAWVYCRRGRVADAILAHAITNGLLATYVVSSGRWFLLS